VSPGKLEAIIPRGVAFERTRLMRTKAALLGALLLVGCGSGDSSSGNVEASTPPADSGGANDASVGTDSGDGASADAEVDSTLPPKDASGDVAVPSTDAGGDASDASDAGDSGDAGVTPVDGGDGGSVDAGSDGGDGGSVDAGSDGGDGGVMDAGGGCLAPTDASAVDAGGPCLVNNGGCDPLTACTNTGGGRTCSACPTGYTGTGATACVADPTYDFEWPHWPLPAEPPTGYVTDAATVKDPTTGLLWQRIVPDPTMIWSEAKAYCQGLVLDGLRGWRVPSTIELLSIVDPTRADPSIDPVAFPCTPWMMTSFWASTPDATTAGNAWYVDFGIGDSLTATTASSIRVRCVR
jgi:hypothetical protein